MFDHVRTAVLRLLRVPHDPDPPAGASGSIRVFRAGKNFYKLRLVRWAVAQLGALVGILISLNVLAEVERGVNHLRGQMNQTTATVPAERSPAAEAGRASTQSKSNATRKERSGATVRVIAQRWPWWVFPLLKILEAIGILLYLVQIPLTYAMARLDYELRWYIVTDRSLRTRSGLASVQEMTMSFANVQQVVVSQGPLQRLLAIADVRVQSAGGGGGGDAHHAALGSSMHTGIFHGVDNANEIRDLILERLRLFRAAGLGDPDDAREAVAATLPGARHVLALTAADELLAEARALRRVLT